MTEHNFNTAIYKEKEDEDEMDLKEREELEKQDNVHRLDNSVYHKDNQMMSMNQGDMKNNLHGYGHRAQIHPDYHYQRRQHSYTHDNAHPMFSPRMPQFFNFSQHDPNSAYQFYDMNGNSQFIPNMPSHDTMKTMRVVKEIRRKPKLRVCSNCVTTTTPSWRRSVDKKQLLCNACGLYQKLHHKPRPFATTPDGKTKALKTGFDKYKCLSCGTSESRVWRKTPSNLPICHSCYIKDVGHNSDIPTDMYEKSIGMRDGYQMQNNDINYRSRMHSNVGYDDMYINKDRFYGGSYPNHMIDSKQPSEINYSDSLDKHEGKYPGNDQHSHKQPTQQMSYAQEYKYGNIEDMKNHNYYRDDGYFYDQKTEGEESSYDGDKNKDNSYNQNYKDKNYVNKGSPDRTEDH